MIRTNSRLIRKPPPVLEPADQLRSESPILEKPENVDQDNFEGILTQYLEKTTVVNNSRGQNPNLHKIDSSDSDMYSSLDPSSISTEPSIQPSYPSPSLSKHSVNSPAFLPGFDDSNKRSSDRKYVSVYKKKKIDIRAIGGPIAQDGAEDGKYSSTLPLSTLSKTSTNISIRNRLKRLSLNDLKPKFTPSHKKFNSDNLGIRRFFSTDNLTLSSTTTTKTTDVSVPFWKYHVLKFGKDLYVTTNPSLKHMYCRNGPGFYIEISHNQGDGFTMVFKDSENQSDKSIPPIMIISKKPSNDGGYFTTTLHRCSQLKNELLSHDTPDPKLFNGLSIPQQIPEEYIPYDKVSNVKTLNRHETNFQNYETRDFNNTRWNIGSIPRVRKSKVNQFKHSLDNKPIEQEPFKFIGRNNIYFHQNYIESSIRLPYKLNSTNPQDTYLETDSDFPPVLGMFRPHEKKLTKKIKASFNKRFSRAFDSTPTVNEITKFTSKTVENDLAGGEIKHYHVAGDGLYHNKFPEDDSPDENKLGWVTIYEDRLLQEKGMFDLVLGLLVATGYEKYLRSNKVSSG